MKIGRIIEIIGACLALVVVVTIASRSGWVASMFPQAPTRLIPELTVKGNLKASSTFRFQIKSKQYFSLVLQKESSDIELSMTDPEGRLIRTVSCSQEGPRQVSEIGSRSGQFVVRLSYCDQGGPGVLYELTLTHPREASHQDQLRVEAEHASAVADLNAALYRSSSRSVAIERYEYATEQWSAVGDRSEEFRARSNLIKLYSEGGNWDQASNATEKASRIAHSNHDSASEFSALIALGAVQLNRGDAGGALKSVRSALKISHSLSSRRLEAEADFLLGKIYFVIDSEEAPNALKEARRIFQELGNRGGSARSMIYLAAIDTNLNRYDTAIDSAEKALAMVSSLGDRQNEGLILILLGNIQFRMGRPQEALSTYGRAESIIGDSGDLFAEGTLLGGVAEAHLNLGQKEAAQEYFARALDKYRLLQDRISIAWELTALGRCFTDTGDTMTALEYLKQARDAFHDVPDKNSEAWVLHDIGSVYEGNGEPQIAFAYMKQALELDRSSAKPDPRLDAKALSGMGHFYETKGNLDLDKAMVYYKEALRLYETAQDRFGRLNTTYRLAQNLHRRGNLKEALAYLEGAIQEIENVRSSVANSSLRTSYFASSRQQYELYIDTLMRLQSDIRAFEASEQSHARTLVDNIAEANLAISDGVDPRLIDSKVSRLKELDAASDKKQIVRLTAELAEVEAQIKIHSPKYAANVQHDVLKLAEVQRELDDSAMLEYSLGEENSYLFLVTKSDFKSYRLPSREKIEAKVRSFRNLIMTPPPAVWSKKEIAAAALQYQQAAADLGRMLLGPASDQLSGRRLVIVADGILHSLPFGALTIVQGNQIGEFEPLAKGNDIVYLPSASALVASRLEAPHRGHPDRSIAVIADPVFQRSDSRFENRQPVSLKATKISQTTQLSNPAEIGPAFRGIAGSVAADLPRLSYTGDEAKAILERVPASSRLEAIGFNATKASIMSSDIGRYRVVHIGTHSILNDDFPDLSSLEFSRWDKNGNPLDGSLRLRDIYSMKLSAELVVLSACDTGIGKEIKGEGLMSMVRGFLSSGVPRVLDTLWKVDDRQTAGFMAEFYKQLLENKRSPVSALREAQKALMEKPSTQSPYYWAGFQLQGDWR